MSFGFPQDQPQLGDVAPEQMLPAGDPSAMMLEPLGPAEMDGGEYLGVEEADVSEPAPRPIDWRVRRYWDNPEERRRLGRWLKEEIDGWYQAASWRLDNLKEWRDAYEMMPAAADTPYTGAATCCAPFTRYSCDAHTRQLNQQIVEPDPAVVAEPMDESAMMDASTVEEAMNGRLEDSEWARQARALHKELPIAGNAFFRVEYEHRMKRVPKLHIDQTEQEYVQAYRALVMAGADPLTAQVAALKRDKKAAIKYSIQWVEEVEYAGTSYKTIPFEDGLLFPPTCRDATQARGIGERFVISGLELRQGAKEGLFIESVVDEILKKQGDEQPEYREDRQDQQGLEIAQTQGPLGDHDPLYRDYDCCRMSLRLDGDDDGKEEILLVTLHYDTGHILDIRFSQYQHGEHIYHLAPFEARPGELLGIGIAETVAVLQDAATATFNQLINHGDLQIHASSCLIVQDTAMIDPDKQHFEMGTFLMVRDPRGVMPWPITTLPTEHYNLFQQMKDQVDLIAGVSNPSLGKGTDVDRTAREVMVVESHAAANFEGVAQGLALFWARVWDQTRSIEAQFARDGWVKYRKGRMARAAAQSPEEMFGAIEAEKLLAKVRLVPAGLNQLSDMQSRITQAMSMHTLFMSTPLTAENPYVQRIAVEAAMEAAKYNRKEQVLLAMDQWEQQQMMMAQQQQMMAQQQADAQTAMGLPPELAAALQQLPPEVLKGLVAQAQQGAQGMPAPSPGAMNSEAPVASDPVSAQDGLGLERA